MINLALVGVGRWGKKYLKTISNIKECNLKYVCSPRINSHSEINNKYVKIKKYKDLFTYKDIDGVIIASPALTHYKIASEFIKRNFNLLIEKPFTTSLNDANKLQKIYNKSNSKVMAGHIYDFNAGFVKTKELLKQIGKINFIEFKNFSNGPKRKDVSELWDRAYHDIYMSLNLLNEMPLSLSSSSDKKIIEINLNYKNGLIINIQASSFSIKKIRTLKIIGKNGSIFFDDVKKIVILYGNNNNIIYTESFTEEPLKIQILSFLKVIKGSKKSQLREALNTVRILEIAEKSLSRNGRECKIE